MARKSQEELEREGVPAKPKASPPKQPKQKASPKQKALPKQPAEPPPCIQYYRVTAVPHRGRVHVRGALTKIHVGKKIDPRGYDLENLRNQGVVLKLIE
jgi:hypothetical protein